MNILICKLSGLSQISSEDWIIFYYSTLKFTRRRFKDDFHKECQANYQLEAVESKKRYNEIFGRKKRPW